MRKLVVLLSILFVLFQSCSSSDSDSTPIDSILVKRIVETTPQGTFTFNYTYNGKKIVQSAFTAPDFLSRVVYTYTGDLLTKLEYFDSSNTLTGTKVYNYNLDDRLDSFVNLDYVSGTGSRVTYTYNPDETITAISYSGDLINQDTVESNNTITLSDGEISSLVENIGIVPRTTTFTYDTKNNPFKNVTGFDKIAYAKAGYFTGSINHNLIQWQIFQTGSPTYTTVQHYTYNSKDFPVTHTAGTNTDTVIRYYY